MKKSKYGFSTRAIHSGQEPDSKTGAVAVPISLSTTFEQDGIETPRGYQYIRTANPTREALETCFADLEGAEYGFAFSSGIAAIDSVFRLLKPGEEVILNGIVYGGTFKLLKKIYKQQYGIDHKVVDSSDLSALKSALSSKTRLIWMESPANPYFNIVDLGGVADIAKSAGVLSALDNTVATPYLQNPLELGVDISVHSATKYLGGHSDVLGGLVAVNSSELAEHIGGVQSTAGAVLSPFDSYMVLRGIKTLGVRMEGVSENALYIAEALEAHKNVMAVNYAGLKSHPGHEIASHQMRNFGGMMSFNLKGGREAVDKLVQNLKLITFAESLGAVETIISHPATMSHVILAGTEHQMDESLVRLSVGLEDKADLEADLNQALDLI